MPEIQPSGRNPLQKFFRQPKIYLKLPSGGQFYPEGSIDLPENKEIPIYSMTAKDELTIKTPDALINGEATIEVIKSCAPNILDPWKMPSIDLEAVLIAIRIATYGENLEIETKVPGTKEERTFVTDLTQVLHVLTESTFEHIIHMKDLKIYVRPLNYREFTNNALRTFEEQKIFKMVFDQKMDETAKRHEFYKSFTKLTEITVQIVSSSITAIEVEGELVDNTAHIQEFINNADKVFFKTVTDHLDGQRKKFAIKPFKIKTTAEEQEKGAPETFEIPLSFDNANFFA